MLRCIDRSDSRLAGDIGEGEGKRSAEKQSRPPGLWPGKETKVLTKTSLGMQGLDCSLQLNNHFFLTVATGSWTSRKPVSAVSLKWYLIQLLLFS